MIKFWKHTYLPTECNVKVNLYDFPGQINPSLLLLLGSSIFFKGGLRETKKRGLTLSVNPL